MTFPTKPNVLSGLIKTNGRAASVGTGGHTNPILANFGSFPKKTAYAWKDLDNASPNANCNSNTKKTAKVRARTKGKENKV